MDIVSENIYRNFLTAYYNYIITEGKYELPTISISNVFNGLFGSKEEVEYLLKEEGTAIEDYLTITETIEGVIKVSMEITQRGIEKFIIPKITGLDAVYKGVFGRGVTPNFKFTISSPKQEIIVFPEHIEEPLPGAMQIFDYKGSGVTFKTVDGTIMVNATEMAKPFGKLTKDYLKLSSTKEFMHVLDNQCRENNPNIDSQLVMIKQGDARNEQGTWMHKDLATYFAMWLAPAFGLWVVQTINEYMQKGVISRIPNDIPNLSNPLETAKKLLEYTGLYVKAEEARLVLEAKVIEDEPKVSAYDQLIGQEGLYDFRDVAQVLGVKGFGRGNLIKFLKDGAIKILGKNAIPYQPYLDKGYFKRKLSPRGSMTTYFTSEGLDFLWRLLRKKGIVKELYRPEF